MYKPTTLLLNSPAPYYLIFDQPPRTQDEPKNNRWVAKLADRVPWAYLKEKYFARPLPQAEQGTWEKPGCACARLPDHPEQVPVFGRGSLVEQAFSDKPTILAVFYIRTPARGYP